MPISRTDVESAIDRHTDYPPATLKTWMREQGMKFTDSQFSKLFNEVMAERDPKWTPRKPRVRAKELDDGVKVRVEEVGAYGSLPQNELPLYGGRLYTPDAYRRTLPGRRFLCTVVQNNTKLHDKAWATLMRYIRDTGTKLLVAQCSYNKNGWQQVTVESEGLWYDSRVKPYVIEEQVKLADDLVFCAELDILPTAQYPLSSLYNYTGHNSAIIPHTKMQMQSLATMKDHPPKLMYSTGALTLRNYIQRKVGQIAEYHHIFGGILVEVDDAGDWFCRQINFNEDGSFTDLDEHWTSNGKVQADSPIVNLADIHAEKLDMEAWAGAMDMIRTLNANTVVCHDTLDFEPRNHHNKRDPLFVAQQHFWRNPRVADGVRHAAYVMHQIEEVLPDAIILNIRSNHDEALLRWLKEGSTFTDPVNARYWHELNAALYRAVEEKNFDFDIYEYAMAHTGYELKNVLFVKEDQSVVFKGIEFGMHGHLGANGAKGHPRQFRQMGRRANTGHTHSAGIIDGVYTAGAMNLDMLYNKGLSSWSVSHILTHETGKRQIVTQRGRKWRA